jgi:hypothetical protein
MKCWGVTIFTRRYLILWVLLGCSLEWCVNLYTVHFPILGRKEALSTPHIGGSFRDSYRTNHFFLHSYDSVASESAATNIANRFPAPGSQPDKELRSAMYPWFEVTSYPPVLGLPSSWWILGTADSQPKPK